jgi:hypothetical protein
MKDQLHRRKQTFLLVGLGLVLGVVLAAPPVGAHVGGTVGHLWREHIKPRADAHYLQDAIVWRHTTGIGTELDTGEGDDDFVCEPNETCFLRVTCPVGYVVLEGGYQWVDEGSQMMGAITPQGELRRWEIYLKNDATPDDFLAAATCIRR